MKTCRFFSSSAVQDLCRKYPFPTTRNPTPHEIFHLQPGADQQTIKTRYYDLVRIHHPDTAAARNIPLQVAQARFQLVSSAYERLQNPHSSKHELGDAERDRIYRDEIRRRSQYRGMRDLDLGEVSTGTRGLWQRDEGFLLVFIMLSVFAVSYHSVMPSPSQISRDHHDRTRRDLYDARMRGKEQGMRRREEIRRWLQEKGATNEERSKVPPELGRSSTSNHSRYLKLPSEEDSNNLDI